MFNGLQLNMVKTPHDHSVIFQFFIQHLQQVQVLLYSNKNANQFMTFIQYIFFYGYVVDILSLSIKTNKEKNLP